MEKRAAHGTPIKNFLQEYPPPVRLGTLTPTSVDLDLLRRSFPLVDYELNSVALYKLFSVTPYELL